MRYSEIQQLDEFDLKKAKKAATAGALAASLALSSSSQHHVNKPETVITYPTEPASYEEPQSSQKMDNPNEVNDFIGIASWYGKKFHGKKTASGERFNKNALTAAHKTLPLGSIVTVTRLDTGKKVKVKINDRGPYVDERIIDLSDGAAQKLGMKKDGTVPVKIELDGEL